MKLQQNAESCRRESRRHQFIARQKRPLREIPRAARLWRVAIQALIEYVRAPSSFLTDSILMPRFLPAVDRKPRTL